MCENLASCLFYRMYTGVCSICTRDEADFELSGFEREDDAGARSIHFRIGAEAILYRKTNVY